MLQWLGAPSVVWSSQRMQGIATALVGGHLMSLQQLAAIASGQQVLPRAPPPAGTHAGCAPLPPAVAAPAIPQALNVCCNGTFGVYVMHQRAVQCLCKQCQAERVASPNAAWVMSPTEFERHSGMPTAKKWRVRSGLHKVPGGKTSHRTSCDCSCG